MTRGFLSATHSGSIGCRPSECYLAVPRQLLSAGRLQLTSLPTEDMSFWGTWGLSGFPPGFRQHFP